MRQNSNYNF